MTPFRRKRFISRLIAVVTGPRNALSKILIWALMSSSVVIPKSTRNSRKAYRLMGVARSRRCRVRCAYWRVNGVDQWHHDGVYFFPPRSDPAHRPQRRCHALQRLARSHSGWFEYAAAGYGAVSVTAPARGRGVLGACPWHCSLLGSIVCSSHLWSCNCTSIFSR